jgi:hypothetical protein
MSILHRVSGSTRISRFRSNLELGTLTAKFPLGSYQIPFDNLFARISSDNSTMGRKTSPDAAPL